MIDLGTLANSSQYKSEKKTLRCVHLSQFVLELDTEPPISSRGVASGWPCSHPDPPRTNT